MVIKEDLLNRILENVEKSLEPFVLENKSKCKNWVSLESLLVKQYNSLLDDGLQSKAYTSMNQLESKNKLIVSNRIREYLVSLKEDYDKKI